MEWASSVTGSLTGTLLAGLISQQIGKRSSGSLFSGVQLESETFGKSWTAWQYAGVGLGAATFGGVAWLTRVSFFKHVAESLMRMSFNKLVMTEAVVRMGAFGDEFGSAEGGVSYDPCGQAWVNQGGRWTAMQGAVVEATPLDGAIVSATPLDGAIVEATALDGPGNFAQTRDYDVVAAYQRAYE